MQYENMGQSDRFGKSHVGSMGLAQCAEVYMLATIFLQRSRVVMNTTLTKAFGYPQELQRHIAYFAICDFRNDTVDAFCEVRQRVERLRRNAVIG